MVHNISKLTIPALIFLSVTACTSSRADETKETPDDTARLTHSNEAPPEVATTLVRKDDFSRELISNGKLEVQNKAKVAFEVQEQISGVGVKEGDLVKKGQVLGTLQPFTYQKALEKALDTYEQACIDLEDKLLGFGYNIEDTSSIPPSVLKMARIRSSFNTASIALEEARHNLQQTVIQAPINGVVSNLEAKAHNPSSAYDYFCDILDNSVMLISFHVLETELNFVSNQQPVEVFPFAMPDKSFKGTVVSINPTVDDEGMIRVTARIPNTGRKLINGMNARVLLKNRVHNCLIVPREAVLYRQNRKVVFVYEDGKAMWHYVQTGYENSSEITITEGLKEGDEVIVGNNLNLAHESKVVRGKEF
jgi:RND family efflux transporter MFP subunit